MEAQAQRAQAVKKLEDQVFIAKVVQFKKPTSDKIKDKVVHGIMELGMPHKKREHKLLSQSPSQCFGSGSAWIRIMMVTPDPNPDPAAIN